MKFNERVLEEAMDKTVPLFERLKFISIFTSNFDEFFMIRVGSLYDLSLIDNNAVDNKTGMSPCQQLNKIYDYAVNLYQYKDHTYKHVEHELNEYGIFNLDIKDLDKTEKKFIEKYYESEILPILSPQIIDPQHPFPHLINKALYIICDFQGDEKKFGLIPVSLSLPQFVLLPGNQTRYVLMEKIIMEQVATIFNMYTIKSASVISVTRNADISAEDEVFEVEDDYREKMKKVIKKRSRLSPVRLEVQEHLSKALTHFLLVKLELEKDQIFICKSPLNMSYVYDLFSKLPPVLGKQLSYQPFDAKYPLTINKSESITNQCRKNDILLFYPYEPMDPFLHLLKESAVDPNVISIKITIYRLSRSSRIIDYLCNAAENNKEVIVLIELKARFDEKNNIEWAEQLETAGCNVIYGFENFKVHSKICLITRRDRNKILYITQIGTGNYNEKTAKLYSDLSLITANQEIGYDANEFFKNMAISNLRGSYNYLLVAPNSLKSSFIALIEHEIAKARVGKKARIIMKANSLTDKEIIEQLSIASQAGVEVILIVRGICCLLPGIVGKTDNIKVISIVGRFLEHARIYCFGEGTETEIYISSADLMTRNTSRRVEIGCPILDTKAKEKVLHILTIMIADNVKGRLLQSDGTYSKLGQEVEQSIDSQTHFIEEVNKQNDINVIPRLWIDKIKRSYPLNKLLSVIQEN